MRVAIVGAGAMGSLLGHGLCKTDAEVTLLDLPYRVSQLKSTGNLVVVGEDGIESALSPALITADFSEAGTQDIVILATKSQVLSTVARGVAGLLRQDSVVVTIQNGIPWWYLQSMPGYSGNARIRCLDPDGLLERNISPSKIVGCVAYPAAIIEKDGRVRHVEGMKCPVGEIDGSARERTQVIANLLEDAGFKSRVINDIRSEIWLKAWGALSINPISALTRATMEDICTFTGTRELVAQMMREAQQVAEAYGATFRHTIEKRIDGARAVGSHKTSMLQDVENGQCLELDALMLAIIELAGMVSKEIPTIQNIYACTALLNEGLLKMQAQSGTFDR